MNTMILSGLLFAVFLCALLFTGMIRSYALKNLLDIPNQRSSHRIPTPRGGGMAIVIAYALFIGVVFILGYAATNHLWILSTGIITAAIGFWDDHRAIAARWRFLIHLITASIALSLMHGLPALRWLGTTHMDFALPEYVIGLFFLVWALNLFNFMDGIDGIAASEAVFVAGALSGFMYSVDFQLALLAAGLCACSLGFLFWNWPPAKIFLGDAGSGFLGFTLGLLILIFSYKDTNFIFIGLILFAVFVTDATYTLAFRFIDGQKWFEAHCSHAYQHAAGLRGHRNVMLSVWAINLFWLLPLAATVNYLSEYAWWGLSLAYIPLFYIAFMFSAGKESFV